VLVMGIVEPFKLGWFVMSQVLLGTAECSMQNAECKMFKSDSHFAFCL
jgi:hypothetical protein